MTGQISSSLLFFVLCWSRNMTTGAWVVGWNCTTDTICSHYKITWYTHTHQPSHTFQPQIANIRQTSRHRNTYFPHFTVPEGSLPQLQVPTTYPQPDQSPSALTNLINWQCRDIHTFTWCAYKRVTISETLTKHRNKSGQQRRVLFKRHVTNTYEGKEV